MVGLRHLGRGCRNGIAAYGEYLISTLLAVWGASSFWSIGELFEQRKRVAKGWFPKRETKGACNEKCVSKEYGDDNGK